jgi:aminoglycoside phosphotransferase (APT) family kinase protein
VVESISKTRVDRRIAAAIIKAAFGGTASLVTFEECEEGWYNAVHRLGLSDGTSCILKVAPPPGVRVLRYEHDIMTTEVDALRLVGERTDVPVPSVLVWDHTCELLPSPYFLMEQCGGVLLSALRSTFDPDTHADIDAQLARHLASMNAITASAFGRPDRSAARDSSWSAAFGRLVNDLLADAADTEVELPLAYEDVAKLVQQAKAQLDVVTTPQLVHWDLWDTNVLIDPDTLTVVGVIDFERVLWGDPLMEAQFLGKRAGDSVVEAYGRPLFDEPGAAARRRLYDLYLYLVMIVECAYRNYPIDDSEQLARAGLAAVIDEIRAA